MSSDQAISPPINEIAAQPDTSDVDWLLDEEHGFVVFFRPRCGSTTLTRWFFENKGVKFGGFSISAYRNEWLQPRIVQLQSYLEANYDKLHKFVVIRDPMSCAPMSILELANMTSALPNGWNTSRKSIWTELISSGAGSRRCRAGRAGSLMW